ncbi:MAG: amino acid ABC transporter permease [Eubacterium sp.]|nr:amino acid ABC transporter permease [Eubacterium sp.]
MSERLFGILTESFPKILMACIQVTIPLTLLVFSIGLILGFFLALVQVANVPVLRRAARVYVWLFRGTPLLVQLYIVFFGLPSIGITLDAFPSALIAFSLNNAAYTSETVRAALLSVPQGQTEAGYMVGLSYGQIMRRIVIPQAARVAFPTLSNSLISLTKDTSLAAAITVVELFKTAQQVAAVYFEPFALYCEAALVYLMLNTLLTLLQSFLEKKINPTSAKKTRRSLIQIGKEKNHA